MKSNIRDVGGVEFRSTITYLVVRPTVTRGGRGVGGCLALRHGGYRRVGDVAAPGVGSPTQWHTPRLQLSIEHSRSCTSGCLSLRSFSLAATFSTSITVPRSPFQFFYRRR